MEEAVLILGSNMGHREQNLDRALELIGRRAGTVIRTSGVYPTEPWGRVEGEEGAEARDFLNRAVVVGTELEPEELLGVLQGIEAECGRTPRPVQRTGDGGRLYRSRSLDIDIIYYGERVVDLPHLQIPHPLVQERAFVLVPLAEAAPGKAHPVTGLTPAGMLRKLKK